jgi:rubrerythrin
MKCRKKVEIQNPERVILKNRAVALKGTCPISGTKVVRFVRRRIGPTDALEVGIEREKEAGRFYNLAADVTADPHGKAMFRWLASEETWHRVHLETQLQARLQGSPWLKWEERNSPVAAGEFPDLSETGDDYYPSPDELDALRDAIETEKESMEFYRESAGATTDPAGRTMFVSLAAQEEGHLALLERQAEWLDRHRRYFVLVRFSV